MRKVKNPLVISIGIRKYDDYLDELPVVDNDISYYRDVFSKLYKYKFIYNQTKNPMIKRGLRNFLRYAKRNLITEDDDGNIELHHDGLIITLSGHGTHDSLICSGGERYKYRDIRLMNHYVKYLKLYYQMQIVVMLILIIIEVQNHKKYKHLMIHVF